MHQIAPPHLPGVPTAAPARYPLLLFGLLGLLVSGACRGPSKPVPPPTATVTGTVLRSQGGAAPGATVVLTADPDQGNVPFATVKATAAGAYHIDRIPLGRYRLHAGAPGYIDAMTRIEVTGSQEKRLNLKLSPTVLLAGRIEDERGTAIPLARVLVFAVGDATSATIHETRADERGGFKVLGLAPGAHRLLIEAPGMGTASAGPVQAPDETVVVILPGKIRAILGRVTRAGEPVRGARILLGGEAVSEARSTDSGPDGRFAFAGLGPGTYALRAEAGGLVTPVVKESVPERAPAQPRQLELALAPGGYARGKVVSDGGRPVPGAAVHVDLVPPTGLWPPIPTDAEGAWSSTALAPGSYRVRARRDGFVARGTALVSIAAFDAPPAAANPALTLELMRTGQVAGRVVDERGAPVAGATVHDRLADAEELGVILGRLPLAAEAAALPAGAALPEISTKAPARRATTDGAGQFVLKDVPPGRIQVEVLNASSVPLRTAPALLAPGARLDVGTLRVQGAVQAAGRVVGPDGAAIPGARVSLAPEGSSAADAARGLYAVTGPDGAFSLPLPAGEHRLVASASGYLDATTTVRLEGRGASGAAPTILRLAKGVRDLTGVVHGAVHDAEGRPLARARITVRPASVVSPETKSGGSSSGAPAVPVAVAPFGLPSGLTDAGGAFRIVGVPAAPMVLEVQHEGYAPHRVTVDPRAANAVRVVVPLPGGIDGEVHEQITGAPVPKFHIDAHGPDGARVRFPDSAAGRKRAGAAGDPGGPLRFSLRRLTPGRWTLRVQAAGYRPLERVVEVASASSPGAASVRDLRLELERS